MESTIQYYKVYSSCASGATDDDYLTFKLAHVHVHSVHVTGSRKRADFTHAVNDFSVEAVKA